MFTLSVEVDVHGRNFNSLWRIEILTPFVPFIGMKLTLNDWGRDAHVIEEITWNVVQNRFDVYLESEEWDSDLDSVKHELQLLGWSLIDISPSLYSAVDDLR